MVLEVAGSVLGVVLLVLVARDVFLQLFEPEGSATLTTVIMRGCRAVARRTGRRRMARAGPLGLALVLGAWFAITVLAWALLLWPHVPDSFSYGPGVPPLHPLVDAAYVSLVGISTLGFGDVVPSTSPMRILVPLEAVMGFGLLTAGLTWVLSTYPPLCRLRLLGAQAHELLAHGEVRTADLDELARAVHASTIDLRLSGTIYFFEPGDERESFAAVALALLRVARQHADGDDDRAAAARALERALERYARVLAERFVQVPAGAPSERVLEAYRRDSEQVGGGASRRSRQQRVR